MTVLLRIGERVRKGGGRGQNKMEVESGSKKLIILFCVFLWLFCGKKEVNFSLAGKKEKVLNVSTVYVHGTHHRIK